MNLSPTPRNLWFKVLKTNGEPIDGSNERWSLPQRQQRGNWTNFENQEALLEADHCWKKVKGVFGTWLIKNPKQLSSRSKATNIYIAEWSGAISQPENGLIWVSNARLIREATNLDVKRFGIFRGFRQILE